MFSAKLFDIRSLVLILIVWCSLPKLIDLKDAHAAALNLEKISAEHQRYYGGGDHTRRARAADLGSLVEYANSVGALTLADITPRILDAWVSSLVDAGYAPATVCRRVAHAKHFFSRQCPQHRLVDPSVDLRAPTISPHKPKAQTSTECDKLRAVVSDPRDRLILELLYRAGLRRAEVPAINWGQVDLAGCTLQNVKRKRSKYQTIAMSESIVRAIEAYQSDRAEKLGPYSTVAEYPLVLSSHLTRLSDPESFRLSAESVYRTIKRIAKAAGLEGAHPHRLRHSFVTEFLDLTGDIRLTAQAAGHSNINTTMRYAVATDDAIRNAVRKLK